MGVNREFWRNKRVFLTGHTGFKGGWLALWLSNMGAEVHGYALAPPTNPNFFTSCDLETRFKSSCIADIRDMATLVETMQTIKPDIVLHLAAQAQVRYSYDEPVETYAVNVMGTVHLLEAVRKTSSVKAVINVTSDKCYENYESQNAYREDEAMGGYDPYSSSKGCSEIISSAYRRSYMQSTGKYLATARAGNVIGGGDWTKDRLIPDFFRALEEKNKLIIRFPQATRPWQHVLEPLSGYLLLAENLFMHGREFTGAWNFGPDESGNQSVEWIVEHMCQYEPRAKWGSDIDSQPHEAGYLKLDNTKVKTQLGWYPRWNLKTTLKNTIGWHQAFDQGKNMATFSLEQIRSYENC